MPYPTMLTAFPRSSNTTHSDTSILKSKPTYENNPPGNLPNASLTVAVNFSWTLALCVHRLMTTDVPTKPPTGSFSRTMAIARIY
mgnify:CR=1 FL=1